MKSNLIGGVTVDLQRSYCYPYQEEARKLMGGMRRIILEKQYNSFFILNFAAIRAE